jgi:hypothetical protein
VRHRDPAGGVTPTWATSSLDSARDDPELAERANAAAPPRYHRPRAYPFFRLRAAVAIPTSPLPSSTIVAGSGTAGFPWMSNAMSL